ncbi:response regulator [candidate division KSB1 bacterium]|nr:response regulator [candidate division KSB1 bacterium]
MNSNEKAMILVIDDEIKIQQLLIDMLNYKGYKVIGASNGQQAKKILNSENIDLVFLDLRLPDIDGTDLLLHIKQLDSLLPVIIISAYGDIPTAVKATQLGAADFLVKPLDAKQIFRAIEKEIKEHSKALGQKFKVKEFQSRYGLIGISDPMIRLYETIEKTAPTDAAVLIHGETGTGKELVAQAIHCLSHRRKGPFVRVNCSAIPTHLIESELFGHKKGAFTGAFADYKGKLAHAHGGTILLDEIGDMDPLNQAKVLRVLQSGEYEPVGSSTLKHVNIRIISATNKNLEYEIRKNRFRSDLYFRLNVIHIELLPLRERKDDIPHLFDYYLKYFCDEYHQKHKRFTPQAMEILLSREWKGNIRELKNVAEKLVVLGEAQVISLHELQAVLELQEIQTLDRGEMTLKEARDQFEKEFIFNKLISHNYNITATAQALGIERTNLYRKMHSLGIRFSR